jgi:hypothetical protein
VFANFAAGTADKAVIDMLARWNASAGRTADFDDACHIGLSLSTRFFRGEFEVEHWRELLERFERQPPFAA